MVGQMKMKKKRQKNYADLRDDHFVRFENGAKGFDFGMTTTMLQTSSVLFHGERILFHFVCNDGGVEQREDTTDSPRKGTCPIARNTQDENILATLRIVATSVEMGITLFISAKARAEQILNLVQ